MSIYTAIFLFVILYLVLNRMANKKVSENKGASNLHDHEGNVRGFPSHGQREPSMILENHGEVPRLSQEGMAVYYESRGEYEKALLARALSDKLI